MIDPNSTATKVQPSFSHNARSFIAVRSIDNRLFFRFRISGDGCRGLAAILDDHLFDSQCFIRRF
jgi:hypothetical protein